MEKPTRKKQKRIQENAEAGPSESRPKKTRVKGKLRDLLSMPLDVLFEIFGHLLPQDLLRLARINKDFRTVLMARSTISVWKSARLNADCPDPPEGMSEPAWADLAFDNHCHFCFAIGVRNVEWVLRTRICKKCTSANLVEFRYGDARRVPTAVLPAIPSRHSRGYVGVLAMDMSIVAQWKDLPTDEAKKEFVAERKVIVDKIKEHAARCEIWAEGRSQNRTSELENLRDARYKAIVARLRDLGWGPELDLAPVIAADYTQQHLLLSRQKQVNAPQRLTDKIWKNIEKPVIEFMSQIRVYRLRRERQSLINDRKTAAIAVLRTFKISQLPFTELMPGAADFCVLPPVKALIDQPSEIDPDFDTIIPFIPDLFATWREAKEQKLKDLIGGDEESDTNPNLELASFLFICQPCTPRRALSFLNLFSASANSNPTVWFPEALSHHCCSLAASLPWTGRESTDVAANLTTQHRKRREWTPTYHKIDSSGHVGVKAIIEAAGLDPETATVDDMDQLDIYFACTTCESDFSSRPKIVARGWRKAVTHMVAKHAISDEIIAERALHRRLMASVYAFDYMSSDDETEDDEPNYGVSNAAWRTMPSSEVAEMKDAVQEAGRDALADWGCVHCMDLVVEPARQDIQKIKDHVTIKHEIATPKENEDYYRQLPDRFPDSIAYDEIVIPIIATEPTEPEASGSSSGGCL